MPSVIIIGAGIGGLCLAQGLTRAGIDVAVYERDPSPATRHQGYRLGIKADGSSALRACLPPHRYDLVVATSSAPPTGGLLAFYDQDLRQTFARPLPPPDGASFGVNRLTLREILADGIDVHFGQFFQGYRQHGDRVRAHFADGGHAEADLLVGADGVGSRVRAQLLPDAGVDILGHSVYGRTPMTGGLVAGIPAPFVTGFARVKAKDGTGMGIGAFSPRRPITQPGLTPVDDYLMWTLPLADGIADEEVHRYARDLIAGWHPGLRRVVDEATTEDTFAVTLHSALPVEPWPDPRVTLLGDAIHAMSPGRGEGANTALRDAATLCGALAAHGSVEAATVDYRAAMLDYGFAAVTASRERPFGPRRGAATA